MSTIARLYNFISGQASNADAVDAEFDQIIAFLTGSVVHVDGSKAMTGALTLPANPTTALQAATKQYVDAQVSAPALPGVVCMFGGTAPPVGWLQCNGQAISRTTYSTLYNAIGTTHGAGDGATTFNVPDMNGRVPVGPGSNGTGYTNWALGQKFGSDWPQSHAHTVYDVGDQQFYLGKVNGDALIGLPYGVANRSMSSAGTGQTQNVQPGTGILFIVKT